jgi:CRP/FNR family cyclic AMP-dependent transcriptional regulator
MPDAELIARMAATPLCADLVDGDWDDLVVGIRRVSFEPGQDLMRQGEPPEGFFFIISGRVQVLTKLPGGGEILVAMLEAGSTVGELALIGMTRRTATVRALGRVEAVYADAQVFRAALVQLRPSAIKILRRLALILSDRLRILHGRIQDAIRSDPKGYASSRLPAAAGDTSALRGAPPDFDYLRFLPMLKCFRDFDADTIRSVAEQAEVLTLPRGAPLLSAGATPEACDVVVRGAVASGFIDGDRMHQIAVLGPGHFCAVGAMIENMPASASHIVREDAVLLRFSRSAFLDLFMQTDRRALSLLRAVSEDRADAVTRANNHLTRLVGLTRLSRQMAGRNDYAI